MLVSCSLVAWLLESTTAYAATGQLEIRVVDAADGRPLAARVELTNARGRPVVPKRTVRLGSHFCIDGSFVLDLRPGVYQFSIQRGPEYRQQRGHFEMSGGDRDHKTVQLTRFANLSDDGWWAADCQCHRTSRQLPLLMRAEDLYLAMAYPNPPRIEGGWAERIESISGSEHLKDRPLLAQTIMDIRSGTPLLIAHDGGQPEHTQRALLGTAGIEHTIKWLTPLVELAGQRSYAGHATAWELPLWIASRRLDAIMVMGPHENVAREAVYWPAGSSPQFDVTKRSALNVGRQSELVYHKLLECGVRIAPVAGSGSGWNKSPLGAQRVYAHIRAEPTVEQWWKSFKRGRLMLTNGPLLVPRVNGKPPGYLFTGAEGEEIELDISLKLHTTQKVEYLEIIKNGRVEHSVRLDAWAKANGELPIVTFKQSGWMLVRAVTDESEFYQYAMTAPYFVKIGERPRVSRSAVQFFVDWLRADYQRKDKTVGEEVLKYYRAADRFWQTKLVSATVD